MKSERKVAIVFVPEWKFEPHVQQVLTTCWREVSFWFRDFSEALVEIYLVSDKKMKQLNALHRKLDKVTDVLSLDYGVDRQGTKLGVIYLAQGVVRKIAMHFQHSSEDEIVFLSVHGMLHIWGYDHEEKADEAEMLRAMKIVLENVPHYTPLLATYKRRSSIDY